MRVLAIETATDLVGAAIADDAGLVAEAVAIGRRRHAECLAPSVRHVVSQAGVALGDVDIVAVDVGPGLFTGLRVGVATANGLASGLGRPVLGISSLEVLAAGRPGRVLAVVDARRGQVFVARYEDGVATLAPTLLDPADLPAATGEPPVVAVGDGAIAYAAVLAAVPGVEIGPLSGRYPRPGVLAGLALEHLAVDPAAAAAPPVLPTYLRPADVRVGWASRPTVREG